jgi:hypothetical protein
VRTFALASLLGALGALLGPGALVAAVAFVGAAALVGYRRGEDPGLTTNTITTAVLAGALGGRRYAWRVVVGLVLVLAAAWAGGMLAS